MTETDLQQSIDEQEQNGDREISLRKRFFNLNTFISFAAALAIMYFLATRVNLDFGELWDNMRGADPLKYILALIIYYLSFPLRGGRWRLLLRNVGYHRSVGIKVPSVLGLSEIIFLSWFANCIVPAKLGDMYRAYLLKKNAGVSFSKTFGTILAERVIDMLVLFAMMALAALALMRGKNAGTAIGVVEIGFVFVIVIAIILVALFRYGGQIERRLPRRVRDFYNRFLEGTLDSFRELPVIALITVLVWLCEVGRLYMVTQALGIEIGFAMIVFVALANSLLTTLPLTPGGLGFVEAGVTSLLMMSVSRDLAASVAILDRTISYGSLILFGLVLYLFSQKK